VFAILPREHIATLQKEFDFQVWDEARTEVRLVASFDTTEEDVRSFANHVRTCLTR
jgi:threonine aldolase